MASVNKREDDIDLILKSLNPEKARWDDTSIWMIHVCGKAIVEPLPILILSFSKEGVYPDDWKKTNVVPTKNIRELSRMSHNVSFWSFL